ncbi:MAG: type IV secretory system conjugative DNA transfer family protein [Planctomycetes bacterium]|nr:type IV secretory system conjugative DNA transfer family protein [Planctomycetota bacterium]
MFSTFARKLTSGLPVFDDQHKGVLLGWDKATGPNGGRAAVTYDGDAPLLTCAATGAGKGRGVLIPNMMTYRGQLIAVDIKGELYQVTSRRRREMGQQVAVLDPFHLVTDRSDSLNPLDLMTLPRSDIDSDSEMLASLLAVGNAFEREPFWNITANGLMAGIIAHIASGAPKDRHLGQLRAWLYHQDLEMTMAKMLDAGVVRSRVAWDQFVAYLNAPHEQTRPCIKTTACSYVSALGSEQVVETLRASSFRLQDVYDGKPLSIYIVIPPDKLESHKALLRLWVGTLLTTIMRRTTMPRQRTLFLLDECAQLGPLDSLRQAITLLRGSGLQTWTFWQDLSQLRQVYPKDWQTIVNNSGMLQVFGITNHLMAKEWSELLGLSLQDLKELAREDAVALRQGEGSVVCRRPDYLKDEVFAGMFDANQRFALQGVRP